MDDALAFRPPQFSEDLAWLPNWVQHQVEQFEECVNEPLGSSKLGSKDSTLFQGNLCGGKDQMLLSREEARHNNSYYLFLSGEDNSPSSFAPSCGNVLQLHLHLSSDVCSERVPSQLDTSQTVYETDKVLSMQKFDTSVALKENRCEMNFNPGGLNVLPQSSNPEPCPRHPSNSKDSIRHHGEKFNVGHLKDAEINDAVELSIAASEALVIHEIVKSKPDLEALVTADALEVSLRVKQARLEWLQDAFNSSSKDTDEDDCLSDLDDFELTDAFEDVGLICSTSDQNVKASAISLVKETPASGNHCARANQSGFMELCAQQVNFDGIYTQEKFEDVLDAIPRKGLPLEPLNSDRQDKVFDVDLFGSITTNAARENEFLMPKNQSVIVGLAAVDLTSSELRKEENNVKDDSSLDNARENRLTYPVPERFRSRWLGGWFVEKEIDAPAQLKQDNAGKGILKAFTRETSFLSESADIVPDENSVVQIRETNFNGASQSSVAVEGVLEKASKEILLSQIRETNFNGASQSSVAVEGSLDKANKEILLSQDVVMSSSLSLVDPLCSVVPCSVPSEDANSAEAQNQNNKEADSERDFRTQVELDLGNSGNTSNKNVQFQSGDGQVIHITNEGSEKMVRRQLTSLKTYSTLFPSSFATSDVGRLHHNVSFQPQFSLGLLALNQNMGSISDSDKGCSKQIPFFNSSVCKYFAGRENEGFCETVINGNPIEKVKKKDVTNREIAGDVDDLPVHSPKGGVQPLLLNRMVRRRLQASKPSAVNSYDEEHSKRASGLKDRIRHQPSERPRNQNGQSGYKHSDDGHFPARKRVRFSEAEIQIEPNNNSKELQFSKINCSTMTKNEKLKKIDKLADYCIHDESFLNRCSSIDKGLMLFDGLRFLLTGLSRQKGKDIKEKIQKHRGIILSDIPFPPNSRGKKFSRSNWYQLPIILSSGKQRTTKFLYGCAVKASILNVDWLADSIGAGALLPPEKYLILRWHETQSGSIWKQVHDNKSNGIFEKVGIMLHGKHSFCFKLAKIVKHGGGHVYKTLQWLVNSLDKEKISAGAIVTEDENTASRHLRQCACERRIPMMPVSWIIKSLHSGELLPFTE